MPALRVVSEVVAEALTVVWSVSASNWKRLVNGFPVEAEPMLETDAENEVADPATAVVGRAAFAVRSGCDGTLTVTEFEHDTAPVDWAPEVTFTVAVLVPVVAYVFEVVVAVPERESVPLQEYV